MRSRFKKALKRAGITRLVRFHDLRHTFGTQMAAIGVPMRTLPPSIRLPRARDRG
jgi:integrase